MAGSEDFRVLLDGCLEGILDFQIRNFGISLLGDEFVEGLVEVGGGHFICHCGAGALLQHRGGGAWRKRLGGLCGQWRSELAGNLAWRRQGRSGGHCGQWKRQGAVWKRCACGGRADRGKRQWGELRKWRRWRQILELRTRIGRWGLCANSES